MLLKELIRFSTQHRTLYCYLILSIWIFLLIAGMYKYIGQNGTSLSNSLGFFAHKNTKHLYGVGSGAGGVGGISSLTGDEIIDEETLKFRKFTERCTPLENLARQEDGGILDGWKLQGVLLVIRHGDRGPMSHVRGVASVNCGAAENDQLVNRYRSFLYNSTSSSSSATGSNHMYWNKIGPFHGFALLPPADKACLLGQLTYKGIAQMLHVGEILYQIYAHPLGLLYKQYPAYKSLLPAIGASTPHSLLNSDEVILFSTRYRRTFQSALALLFTFLPPDKWLALNVRESHSMAFCFTDCACAQAENYRRRVAAKNAQLLTEHPEIVSVMQWIGSTVLQHTPNGINDPNEVVDAMLTILCHNAPLPCRRLYNGTHAVTTPNTLDLADVINIDQDDTAANLVDINSPSIVGYDDVAANGPAVAATGGSGSSCIERAQVSELLSYVTWQSMREANSDYYKRIGLMRAYGMMRHIVSYMLKMISGDRTKFVLYSGHDWTLQYLTAALGIQTGHTTFIPYAARLAFEVYKSEAHTEYYFRVVYNGRDVTQQVDFCEGGKSLRVTRDSRGNKADLCPIENIIRFLHEDYFAPLNSTNFKDACAVQTKL